MGGHGGLNILPQKKWNVYNHDNRAIVDKDKKQAQLKKKAKYQKDRQQSLQGKLQVLKQEAGIVTKQKQTQKQPLISNINSQFRKINEKGHINLFERQQKIIQNKQITEMKRLQQAEFLKDKNMDYSSKFLGTYADGNKNRPWYIKQKGYLQEKKKPQQLEYLLSVKKSDSHTLNQVIKIQKNMYQKHNQLQRSRDKNTHRATSMQKKTDLQILREKRLKRQQKQRQKALKLKKLRQNY